MQRETFSFVAADHPALATWLAQHPRGHRSRAIVVALEQYIQGPDHVRILAEIADLRTWLEGYHEPTQPLP